MSSHKKYSEEKPLRVPKSTILFEDDGVMLASGIGKNSKEFTVIASKNPHHCNIIGEDEERDEFFLNLYRRQQLCDLSITCNNFQDVFKIHKFALTAHSHKLLELLKKDQELHIIEVDGSNPDILKRVLDYLYTFQIDISQNNLEEICSYAHQLDIRLLKKQCSKYLISTFNNHNVTQHMNLAKKYKLQKVEEKLVEFMVENLENLIHSPNLFNLNADTLTMLLTGQHRQKNKEEVKLKVLVSWLGTNEERIFAHSVRLLNLIEFDDIEPATLCHLLECNKRLTAMPQVNDMLFQAYKHRALSHHPQTSH